MNTCLHLQGFKTGKQWNTLLEQCQIWNYANALVILFELWKHVCGKKKILWKCVGENDEDKIEHKIIFSLNFFQVIMSFFSVAKPFLQGVEFSNPDLQAFETFLFRFELWQETGSIQCKSRAHGVVWNKPHSVVLLDSFCSLYCLC